MRANEFITEAGFWDAIKQGAKEFTLGFAGQTGDWLTDRDKEALMKASPEQAVSALANMLLKVWTEVSKKLETTAKQRGIDLNSENGQELFYDQLEKAIMGSMVKMGVDPRAGKIQDMLDKVFYGARFEDAGKAELRSGFQDLAREAITQERATPKGGKEFTPNGLYLKGAKEEKVYLKDKKGEWNAWARSPLSDKFEASELTPEDQIQLDAYARKNPDSVKKLNLVRYSDNSIAFQGGM